MTAPVYRTHTKATPFGPVAVFWMEREETPRIIRVLLSRPGLSAEVSASIIFPDSPFSSCPEIDLIADSIAAFLEGEDREFPLEWADLGSCSRFQQDVLRGEHGIPRGRLSTYKLIAAHIGKKNGARAVGNSLANNPFPIIVPCHRAVRSDLRLGGYQGGIAMKRVLLEREGITFDITGRVICPRFFYLFTSDRR